MRTPPVAVLLGLLILGSMGTAKPAEAAEPLTFITTKDGKTNVGTILQQLDRGYLFKLRDGTTVVIDYTQVDDVQGAGAPQKEVVVVAPPPPTEAPRAPKRPVHPVNDARVLEEESRGVTLDQRLALRKERLTLAEDVPGLGTSITSEIFGALFLVGGFAFIPYALPMPVWLQRYQDENASGRQAMFAIASGVLLAAGVLFLTIGTIALVSRIIQRVKISRRTSEIDQQLEALGDRPPSALESLRPSGVWNDGLALSLVRF